MADKTISSLSKGAWSSATAYTPGDIVTSAGSSYICIANSTNNVPPNVTYWALLAAGGGDMIGPASATDGAPALFDTTTGKLLKNSTPTGTGNPVLQTSPTLTTPKIGTSINDTNGNEIIITPATASAVNEFTVANAATGNSPTLSMTGGDTNVGLDFKMKGTGKFRKPSIVGVQVFDPATSASTGDGKVFFRVPAELNGMNLTGVNASVYTAGTTGTTDIQIRNKTDSVDMLSTKITIDSTETDTSTAATPAVIDTSKDDVATADILAIDVDAVSTTPPVGLYVELRFELP